MLLVFQKVPGHYINHKIRYSTARTAVRLLQQLQIYLIIIYIAALKYISRHILFKNIFPRQSLKIFTFRVKLSDSIFFLLGLSPTVKLI